MASANWNFNRITLEMMMDYISENAPQDKSWFKSVAFVERKKKAAVKQFDANGMPVMKQAKDKAGNLKFKDGKPVMYQVSKMEELEGAATEKVFSLLVAKRAFCDRYMPEIVPVKQAKKDKASAMLENW